MFLSCSHPVNCKDHIRVKRKKSNHKQVSFNAFLSKIILFEDYENTKFSELGKRKSNMQNFWQQLKQAWMVNRRHWLSVAVIDWHLFRGDFSHSSCWNSVMYHFFQTRLQIREGREFIQSIPIQGILSSRLCCQITSNANVARDPGKPNLPLISD